MIDKRTALAFVLAACCFVPLSVRSEDVDDLKAVVEQGARAQEAGDLDAFMAVIHDQVVSFGPTSRLPTVGKEAFRREAQARFAKTESLSVTRTDPQFRVIGDMGVAWGLYTTTVKPKDGPPVTSSGRYTLTYTKVDGKWLLIAGHVSQMPAEN
jgi:uncharacterized protein (TIGR02246 family)